MKAMLGISLHRYSKLEKALCLPYHAYIISSTKLVIRAKWFLPGSEGGEGRVGGE
jgi:hypothetical protein